MTGSYHRFMTVKTSISLTDSQNAFVRSLVEQGRFPSASAALQQGVELLRQRTEADQVETEALRALLQARRDGDFVSSKQMKGRVAAMAKKKRTQHGV